MGDRCVRARVSGTVQGVGFRFSTQREARTLGARGYVMNLPDQRVEAVFEGSESIVESALAFVRRGPPLARVTNVEIEALEPSGYPDFEIRY
jgi:acylphosphatase